MSQTSASGMTSTLIKNKLVKLSIGAVVCVSTLKYKFSNELNSGYL